MSEEELLLLELEMMRPDNPDDGDTGYDITVFETTARPEEEIAQPKLDKKNPALDVTVFNTRYPDGSVSGDLD